MQNNLGRYFKTICSIVAVAAALQSCKKSLVLDANYPVPSVGISQAAIATLGPGANGIFTVTPRIEAQPYRFIADGAGNKVSLQMGVLRSGVDLGGSVSVNISANTDTVNKFLTALRFPTGTELLPAAAYTLPTSVSIDDGSNNGSFEIPVKLDFLVTNIAKKYAFAITISGSKSDLVNPKLSTAIIYLEPAAILLSAANFSSYVDNPSKTAGFINLSGNAVSYSWNFGDGTPVDTRASPTHKYAASGTYMVVLTATGITGAPSVKSSTIVIP